MSVKKVSKMTLKGCILKMSMKEMDLVCRSAEK